MRLYLVMLIVVMSLTACGLLYKTHDPAPTPSLPPPPDEWATHAGTGVSLKIKVPQGWDTYNTESGIVLSEHMGTAETGGVLEGILVYVFVPHTEQFDLPRSEEINRAWALLKKVVSNPDYVGSALVSEPQAFDWDHHDAAYYLLNNRDGTLTILLAMELPNTENMVVVHVSMPEGHSARVRPLLPEVLSTLTVDGVPIDDTALRHLPDPLEFPSAESLTP